MLVANKKNKIHLEDGGNHALSTRIYPISKRARMPLCPDVNLIGSLWFSILASLTYAVAEWKLTIVSGGGLISDGMSLNFFTSN